MQVSATSSIPGIHDTLTTWTTAAAGLAAGRVRWQLSGAFATAARRRDLLSSRRWQGALQMGSAKYGHRAASSPESWPCRFLSGYCLGPIIGCRIEMPVTVPPLLYCCRTSAPAMVVSIMTRPFAPRSVQGPSLTGIIHESTRNLQSMAFCHSYHHKICTHPHSTSKDTMQLLKNSTSIGMCGTVAGFTTALWQV